MAAVAIPYIRRCVITHLPHALMAAAILVGGMFLLDRSMPVHFVDSSAVPQAAHAGDRVRIDRDVVWRRSCDATIYPEFITAHDVVVAIRPDGLTAAKTGNALVSHIVFLPRALPAGPAEYQARYEFRCGPLGDIWPIRVNAPPIRVNVLPD